MYEVKRKPYVSADVVGVGEDEAVDAGYRGNQDHHIAVLLVYRHAVQDRGVLEPVPDVTGNQTDVQRLLHQLQNIVVDTPKTEQVDHYTLLST